MLSSTHMSMGFWLCKCYECRKPWLHKSFGFRKNEYRRIRKVFRKKMNLVKDYEDYEDISFKCAKYTD